MNPKDSNLSPSEMFLDSLSGYGIGSPDIECAWCGREHLCVNSRFMDDWDHDNSESWEDLCISRHKENPENVVLHYDCDSVSAHEMNNIMFVVGCPCNGLQRYEQFIWDHRQTIRNYLKVRIEQEHAWAEQELTLNKLAGISG